MFNYFYASCIKDSYKITMKNLLSQKFRCFLGSALFKNLNLLKTNGLVTQQLIKKKLILKDLINLSLNIFYEIKEF